LLSSADSVGFNHFLSVYLLAKTVGLISHVPGGLGVFESVVRLLLPVDSSSAGVFGALLAYRVLYYLLPLVLAVAWLLPGCCCTKPAGIPTACLATAPGRCWMPVLLPQVLALMALLGLSPGWLSATLTAWRLASALESGYIPATTFANPVAGFHRHYRACLSAA
jgi:hypothetical protein